MAKLRANWLLGLMTVCSAIALGADAARVTNNRALTPELDFGQLEYQRGKVVLHEVTIRQDQMRVQADLAEATGLDFQDSNWTFSGKVTVSMPEGEMQASQAVVRFTGGRIISATANGSPATFAQRQGTAHAGARGRATRIDYNVASGNVQLDGDAWLSDDSREIRSERIIYSIPQRSFRAESGGADGQRVRGTIKPRVPAPDRSGTEP